VVVSMSTYKIPMHRGGGLVSLAAVLDAIDGEGLEWHLKDLWATASEEFGAEIVELEKQTVSREEGVAFTDFDLREVASHIYQTIECQILGAPAGAIGAPVSADTLEIIAFDSSEWILNVGASQLYRLNLDSDLFQSH
jgi:hypothetical protein